LKWFKLKWQKCTKSSLGNGVYYKRGRRAGSGKLRIPEPSPANEEPG